MGQIKYSTERHEHYVLIELNEEKLTSLNAPTLKSDFVTLHSEGRGTVILNLTNVKYVDSSGLSALLVANRLWKSSNGLFVICNLNEHVKKLITISQLQSTLNIASDLEGAKKMVLLHEVSQPGPEEEAPEETDAE